MVGTKKSKDHIVLSSSHGKHLRNKAIGIKVDLCIPAACDVVLANKHLLSWSALEPLYRGNSNTSLT